MFWTDLLFRVHGFRHLTDKKYPLENNSQAGILLSVGEDYSLLGSVAIPYPGVVVLPS